MKIYFIFNFSNIITSIRHRNTIIFDSRKILYCRETPAKLLKTCLTDSGYIYFVVIEAISIWLNYLIRC